MMTKIIIIIVLLSYFYVSTYNINIIDTTNLQDVHREFDLNKWASPPRGGTRSAGRWRRRPAVAAPAPPKRLVSN